jgi:hypothetical protein
MAQYVNNADFLQALKDYKLQVKEATDRGEDKPILSNYIGECILKIATHLSYKPNFINYTYRDDMILDGIENCIEYIDNFDPDKGSNPFAYFTQIIYFAFLRRIQKEKKHSYIKHKLIQEMPFEMFETQDQDDDMQIKNLYADYMQPTQNFEMFESKKKKEPKATGSSLNDFIGETDGELDR